VERRADDEAPTHTFLVADLAGYTALTEAHGDERAAEAAAEFCNAVRAQLRAHGAEEVNTMGDGILVRVDDPRQAVALGQRIVTGYGAGHLMLGVRVGIHTGSAVRRGDDWFGSAVNLAARVADTARAGEVLVTEPTRQALGRSVRLCPRGRQRFKNVAQWLNVYALVLDNPPPALPVDPVCHMAVDPARAFAHEVVDGIEYFLCSAECASAFAADPGAYTVGG
jgi:adenylate cyclase